MNKMKKNDNMMNNIENDIEKLKKQLRNLSESKLKKIIHPDDKVRF
jgi:hypothetical protein